MRRNALLLAALLAASCSEPPSDVRLPLEDLHRVGAVLTTSDALDCFGTMRAVRHAVEARTGDATGIAAGSIWITEMYDSQGITFVADQQFVVLNVDRWPYIKVQGGSEPWTGFKCWVYARDAAMLVN